MASLMIIQYQSIYWKSAKSLENALQTEYHHFILTFIQRRSLWLPATQVIEESLFFSKFAGLRPFKNLKGYGLLSV